ncbi:MAG: hypothetical protein J6W00_07735 [Lentisphaeria bacterium]|nr:hypothetical protein [Lentisphaeria bacterium]
MTIEFGYQSVAADVARRREWMRGIFFPRGGTPAKKVGSFCPTVFITQI